MIKNKYVWIYFLSLFLFLPINTKAEKIGILHFKQAGTYSNINEAVYQLIESELISYGHIVVPPDKIE